MTEFTVEKSQPLLLVENLHKTFLLEAGLFARADRKVLAVRGVSFEVYKGEVFGLVGESGSGKSTTARCLVHAHPPTSGRILLDKVEVTPHNLPLIRSRMKYVFQDPSSSLDPRMTVEKILTLGRLYSPDKPKKAQVMEEAREMLTAVGLGPEDLSRRPGDFSGGQRQRISLARALMGRPEVLICDEVVSALDVSIQGQILNLLLDLKSQFGLTIVFIAHNLSVVGYLCDRLAVMQGGLIVEEGPAQQILQDPQHPYTRTLADSSPRLKI